MHKILVIDPRQKNVKPGWLGPEYNVVQPASYELENIMEEIRDAEGILTAFRPVPSELMEAVPGLKVVARPGAGIDNIDNIDVEAATRLGVRVCNVTGVRGRALAEHALFLMLYLARHAWMKDDPEGWEATPPIQLTGRTMGVVGLGDIGRNVVKIGHGFGLEILVNTRTPDPAYVPEAAIEFVSFEKMCPRADFIVLAMPLTPETRGFTRAETIGWMKKEVIIINLARGQAVVTGDLLEAVRAGRIAGAGLDVTDPEPLPADHLLRSIPQVLITPHNGSRTAETTAKAMGRSADNIRKALAGERPINLVNPEVMD
ncbi:MAG: NAD(P)-dependent oxidoreductase [Nitrospinota bacterium]|nr:NAD(P)-dependent oxidoreductase [Nitrospinota bacterium]MDP7661944.1 NAD(P)-dependent oxidoreductase [Nitrospinota bacterium]